MIDKLYLEISLGKSSEYIYAYLKLIFRLFLFNIYHILWHLFSELYSCSEFNKWYFLCCISDILTPKIYFHLTLLTTLKFVD